MVQHHSVAGGALRGGTSSRRDCGVYFWIGSDQGQGKERRNEPQRNGLREDKGES